MLWKEKCVDRQRKQSFEDLAIHQKRWQGLSHSLCVGWWWKFYYSRASDREGEQSGMALHRPHFNKREWEEERERESFLETHLVVKWTLGTRSELASISRQGAVCISIIDKKCKRNLCLYASQLTPSASWSKRRTWCCRS